MQSQHLHLQSVDSQQMHPRQSSLSHPQQHQQFQIHQLHHPQQQSHHPTHHHQQQQQQLSQQQSHHQSQSHHHQQPLQQPQQQQQYRAHHQQQQQQQHHHQQPGGSHSQHQLPALQLPNAPPQPGSLALNTNSNSAFPVSSTQQTNSHYAAQTLARENIQSLHHQQSQHTHFPLQNQNSLSQQPIHQQSPGQTSNSFATGQPLQMQPLMPNQQPSQAAFGNLANLSGSMLQAGVVEDGTGNPHHFGNSQPADALPPPYSWDAGHSAHGALTSHNLNSANQNQQQQSLLPIPLVGDTRSSNPLANHNANQPYPGQNGSGQSSFGASLNSNMDVLSSSLNSALVGNGNSLGPNVVNVSPPGVDLPQRHSFSMDDEGGQRPTKTIKKSRASMAMRKNIPPRARSSRGPTTSPVSNTTLPNLNQPTGVGSNPSVDHTGVSGPSVVVGNMASSPAHVARRPRGVSGGKAKGRQRGNARGIDSGEVMGANAMGSNKAVGVVASNQSHDDSASRATAGAMPGTLAPQSFGHAKQVASQAQWPATKKGSMARSRSRRKGDGTTAPVPVHLRNPKRGRARVFRECKACRHENHIRRSDCSNCKAPLPAGKRRRDGNPSYDSKRQAPGSTVTAVPNSHVVASPVGRGRAGMKDEIAASSVISK